MKRIWKNYLYNLSYQILLVIAPLLTTPYVSRVLHANGVGVYSYTHTIATGFALFAALGVNTYGQREIAYHQDDIHDRSKAFWELVLLRIFTTLIVCSVYLVFSLQYNDYRVYLLEQLILVVATMFDVSWFFHGMENFKIIAVRNVIVKVATVALIFLLVKTETDLNKYILINALSVFCGYILFFFYLKGDIEKVPLKFLRPQRHLRGTLEFFIPLIATQLYSQLDKIMLGAITNNAFENGYYEQARKIVNIIILVLTSLNAVMLPRVANLYKKDDLSQIKQYYKKGFSMILLLLAPMIVGLYIVSDNLVIWFLGNDFGPVAILLKMSAFLLVFMSAGNFVGMQYLSPTGKQNQMTCVYLISAAINMILNALLIKNFLSQGAMVASIIAEAFSCFAQVYLLKKSEYNFKMLRDAWKYLVASLIMGCILILLNRVGGVTGAAQTFLDMAVGCLIYGGGLIVMKEENLSLALQKMIQKK